MHTTKRTEATPWLTRAQAGDALRAAGYQVADKTLARKACVGGGPPFRRFGKKPVYELGKVLAWAEAQLTREVSNTSELHVNPGQPASVDA